MVEPARTNPTLEIISDDEADIVKGDWRWKLQGGEARQIVWAYRHLLSHAGTGENDAAIFVWGLTAGIRHEILCNVERLTEKISANERELERLRERRLDQPD